MRLGHPADVYVIGDDDGPHKIGMSGNLKGRLYALRLQAKRNLDVLAFFHRPKGDAWLVERLAHELLSEKRHEGEWFNVSTEQAVEAIAAAIASVEAGNPEQLAEANVCDTPRFRANRVTLDLSMEEHSLLEALSRRLGVSMQGVLRMALLKLNERGGA